MARPSPAPTGHRRLTLLTLVAVTALTGCGRPQYDDVLLIGHRGSPARAPENSLEGFEVAYRQGADGIEFDVQLTADGHNAIMHDETLDRTTSCTGPVRLRTLEELSSCTLANGEPVIALGEGLAAVADWFGLIFVEIKIPEEEVPPAEVIEAQVDRAIETVQASGLAQRIVMISYDETALRRIAARQPDGLVGGWDDFEAESISNANRYDLPWVLMPIRTVEPWMGDIIRGLDRRLAVYQVVTPTEFLVAIEAGSRAIMADDLAALSDMLGRKPTELPPD